MRFLAEQGAYLDNPDAGAGTPLSIAAVRRHTSVVEVLLEFGANRSISGYGWGSALHCAFYGGAREIVQALLGEEDVLPISTICLDTLALLAESGSPSKILRKINSIRQSSGCKAECSPILLAAGRCHFDLLQALYGDRHHQILPR